MSKFLKRLFDSRDRSVEAHIVLPCLGACSLIVLAAYHVICLHNPFDASGLGQGLGCVMGGGGLAAAGQAVQNNKGADNPDEPSK